MGVGEISRLLETNEVCQLCYCIDWAGLAWAVGAGLPEQWW